MLRKNVRKESRRKTRNDNEKTTKTEGRLLFGIKKKLPKISRLGKYLQIKKSNTEIL